MSLSNGLSKDCLEKKNKHNLYTQVVILKFLFTPYYQPCIREILNHLPQRLQNNSLPSRRSVVDTSCAKRDPQSQQKLNFILLEIFYILYPFSNFHDFSKNLDGGARISSHRRRFGSFFIYSEWILPLSLIFGKKLLWKKSLKSFLRRAKRLLPTTPGPTSNLRWNQDYLGRLTSLVDSAWLSLRVSRQVGNKFVCSAWAGPMWLNQCVDLEARRQQGGRRLLLRCRASVAKARGC